MKLKSYIFIHGNASENVIRKIVAIVSQLQCVNEVHYVVDSKPDHCVDCLSV